MQEKKTESYLFNHYYYTLNEFFIVIVNNRYTIFF